MKLRTKLLAAQTPVFAALALVVGVALWIAGELGGAPGAIFHENFRSFDAGRGMLVAVDAIDRELQAAVVRGGPVATHLVAPHEAAFERELALQRSNITESGETVATEELQAAWDAYRVGIAETRSRDDLVQHWQRAWAVRKSVDTILRINRDAMRGKADAAAERARVRSAELVGVALLCLVVALGITGVWLRRLLSPLRTMEHAVQRLAAGDFQARIRVVGDDEVAMLARSVDDMARRIDEYRKSSLGELLRANNRLESVMDSLPDAVLVYDLSGTITGHNRVAVDLLGADRFAFDALPEGLEEAVRAAFERARNDGEPFAPSSLGDAVEVQGPGGPRWVMVGATPVRGASRAVEGVTVALRDVTRARRIEGFRADLVAAAAHELKTPLTSLHMAIHLCLEGAAGPLSDRQGVVLHAAREDCQRLETVVDELLEMAKLESGSARLEPQVVPVRQLLDDAVARHEGDARRQNITLDVLPGDATLTVNVDLERIRHVFDNVLENAIKYGGDETGRVQIGFEEDHALGGVRVFIDDAGPGIPVEMRERVFAKFVRVPGTVKRGSGLGLNIVRDVVAAHGGTIGIEDSPLGGARVWFLLPRGGATNVAEPSWGAV